MLVFYTAKIVQAEYNTNKLVYFIIEAQPIFDLRCKDI